MSSASADTATAAAERQMYWCHECDMSVTLVSPQSSSSSSSSTSQSSLLCPHCLTDFLEHMDFTTPTSSSSTTDAEATTTISSPSILNTDFDPASFVIDPLTTNSDDNYLLNSPQFLRLFQHLADSSDADFPAPVPLNSSPATRASVNAIPTMKISSTMLEHDPILICAICKDQFLLDVEAKRLPCTHLYHPECILPWLSNHNSCPLCRFKLPSEDASACISWRRASMALRFRDMINREDNYGLSSTIRHIARRHRFLFTERMPVDSSQSPTQLGEVDSGIGGRTDSVETVSSVAAERGITIVNSGGDENGLMGIDGLINEDAGTVVSEIRVSPSSFVSANSR